MREQFTAGDMAGTIDVCQPLGEMQHSPASLVGKSKASGLQNQAQKALSETCLTLCDCRGKKSESLCRICVFPQRSKWDLHWKQCGKEVGQVASLKFLEEAGRKPNIHFALFGEVSGIASSVLLFQPQGWLWRSTAQGQHFMPRATAKSVQLPSTHQSVPQVSCQLPRARWGGSPPQDRTYLHCCPS